MTLGEAGEGHDELRIPDFDPRATRRAVRRGILRTAVASLLSLVVGLMMLSIVIQVVSAVVQSRGARDERFKEVVGHGYLVAHPASGYYLAGCCNVGALSMSLFLDSQSEQPGGRYEFVEIRQNILGRIDRDSLPDEELTSVEWALSENPSPSKATTRALTEQLPCPTAATVIIEFPSPMTEATFRAFLHRHYAFPPGFLETTVFLQSPYAIGRPLTWPSPDVDGFVKWANLLRASDEANLDILGLPGSQEIKDVARSPRIFAFVDEGVGRGQLQRFVNDPGVASVNVAEADYDLTARRGGIERQCRGDRRES